MTDTDNPLKSLILTYKETFAEWLMGKRLSAHLDHRTASFTPA